MTTSSSSSSQATAVPLSQTGVGKSCLLIRYVEQQFKNDHEPTLGVEFASKTTVINGLTIKTQIWDTAGQQSFRAITRSYYKGSICAFLVFDVTNRVSFQNLHKWLYQIKNYSHEKIQICVLGNKIDLSQKREVSIQQAQTFARNNGFPYAQVSAKTGDRVVEIFTQMSQGVLDRINSGQINPDAQSSIGVRKGKKQNKGIVTSTNVVPGIAQKSQQKKGCCGGS